MATKYVECSRKTGMNDTQTIQAAIEALKDGDTLVFNKKTEIKDESTGAVIGYDTTYVLDAPVDFTRCNVGDDETPVIVNKTRKYLTINGNGCTVCGSDSFIETYGKTGTGNKNALFYTSDNTGCGMEYCTIRNFHFTWKSSESNKSADRSIRNMGMGVVTKKDSPYFSNSIIENCTFEDFRIGLYQCGKDSIIRGCTFTNCHEGILSDGSVRNVFEDNYFYTTWYVGLHLGSSGDSIARNNKFYKCKVFSIFATGAFESSTNSKDTRITITDNKIYGEGVDIANRTDYGIKLQAVHQAVVSGNIICDIGGNDDTSGYGIYVDGNLNAYKDGYDSICVSKEVTVSNNVIYGCCGGGIRVNNSAGVLISGNNIINNPENDPDEDSGRTKYGIVIRLKTHGATVSNNMIYQFDEGNAISVSQGADIVVIQNNSVINERFVLEDHIMNDRIIDNATYSTPGITLPNSTSEFSNGEKFRLKIPENYTEAAILVIAYNGNAYMLHGNNSSDPTDDSETINFPTEKAGKYIWIEYRSIGEGYRFFYMDDYIPAADQSNTTN